MKKFGIGCGAVVVILIVILVIAGFALGGSYNRIVKLDQNVNEKWAQVQNVYQRRADLIPNLVSTVSGAANFEKSTLIAVTQARASVGQVKLDPNKAPTDAAQLQQFQQAQGQLSNALSRLLLVSEQYPELKANQNFLSLQAQLEGTENRISVDPDLGRVLPLVAAALWLDRRHHHRLHSRSAAQLQGQEGRRGQGRDRADPQGGVTSRWILYPV